jgi:hypothetical protein
VLPPPASGHGLESPALGNAEPLDRHHQRLALEIGGGGVGSDDNQDVS